MVSTKLFFLISPHMVPPLDDVGSFSFGLGHFMKPHRVRMAHNLVSAYGMLDKMTVLVCFDIKRYCNSSLYSEASTMLPRSNDGFSYRRIR